MTAYKFKEHVYSAPYAPHYDAYKGHTFKTKHCMEDYETAATKQAAKLRKLFTSDTAHLDAKDWVILRLLRLAASTMLNVDRGEDFYKSFEFMRKQLTWPVCEEALKQLRKEEKSVDTSVYKKGTLADCTETDTAFTSG